MDATDAARPNAARKDGGQSTATKVAKTAPGNATKVAKTAPGNAAAPANAPKSFKGKPGQHKPGENNDGTPAKNLRADGPKPPPQGNPPPKPEPKKRKKPLKAGDMKAMGPATGITAKPKRRSPQPKQSFASAMTGGKMESIEDIIKKQVEDLIEEAKAKPVKKSLFKPSTWISPKPKSDPYGDLLSKQKPAGSDQQKRKVKVKITKRPK